MNPFLFVKKTKEFSGLKISTSNLGSTSSLGSFALDSVDEIFIKTEKAG